MSLRKISAALAVIMAAAAVCCVSAKATGTQEKTEVYVTISVGETKLAHEKTAVTDVDSDGSLTVSDALFCAHEENFEGGAAAGYAAEKTEYGLSLTKLWGTQYESGFGYYVNNTAAMSLEDEIHDGDGISAFAFTDTVGWSDTYSFFDNDAVTLPQEGGKVSLTLYAAGYDESWNPVTYPVSGAEIIIDGVSQGIMTDENGAVELDFDTQGRYIVSAKSDSRLLVPPVCVVSAGEQTEERTETVRERKPDFKTYVIMLIVLCVIVFLALGAIRKKRGRA